MSVKTKAAIGSFLRTLAACLVTAVTTVMGVKGYGPLDFTAGDWKATGNGFIGAFLLFAANYLRPGETRFGNGSQDIGMGGSDVLEPPEGKLQTPEGPVSLLPPVDGSVAPPPGSRADRIRRHKGG